MKKIFFAIILLGIIYSANAQSIAQYRYGMYNGTYIHGVDDSGNPAPSGDQSYRELPLGITRGGLYLVELR